MRERILKLREEGKTYDEIAKILGCSKGSIAYHAGKGVKARHLLKQKERRLDRKTLAIFNAGGKCLICGYDKCSHALEFHHLDPKSKDLNFKDFRTWSEEKMILELKKCILVCANCHREIHAGITKTGATDKN